MRRYGVGICQEHSRYSSRSAVSCFSFLLATWEEEYVALRMWVMVISGGNFKPDTLKPKEVVSLLLDDDELEKKCECLRHALNASIS